MKDFNNFLQEMAASTRELDLEFIKRAEVVSSFNITGADFGHTRYKEEIQYLITKHFFPNFDLANTAATFNESAVNGVIKQLKSLDSGKFNQLMSWTPKGVGPGEVLLYYVIDDCSLGGGSSAGVDITSGGTGYEVKAANLSKDGYFTGYRLGGTANVSGAMKKAVEITQKLKIRTTRETEINKSQIAQILASKYANEWMDEVVQPFKKAAADYFKGHDTIFMINQTPKAMRGEVFQKTISEADIELGAITGGGIAPKVRK